MLLTQLYVYLLRDTPADVEPRDVRAILEQIAGPGGKEEIVNAGEQLIEQGRVEGLRAAVEATMAARGMALSALGRARLAACSDVTLLTAWVTRAATAPAEADVFVAR